MQKEKIYHIYSNENIIAHSLTFDELCDKINNEEINLENVEILQLSPPQYSEASY